MSISNSLDDFALKFVVILAPLDAAADMPDLEGDLGTAEAVHVKAVFDVGVNASVRYGRRLIRSVVAFVIVYVALLLSSLLDNLTPLWLDEVIVLAGLLTIIGMPIGVIVRTYRMRDSHGALSHIHALDSVLRAWRGMRDCRVACSTSTDDRRHRKARMVAARCLQLAAGQVRIRYPKVGSRLSSYGAFHMSKERSQRAARATLSLVTPLVDGDTAEMQDAQQRLAQMASALASKDWDALPVVGLSQDVRLGWVSSINWTEVRNAVLGVAGLVLAWLAIPR